MTSGQTRKSLKYNNIFFGDCQYQKEKSFKKKRKNPSMLAMFTFINVFYDSENFTCIICLFMIEWYQEFAEREAFWRKEV